MKFDGLSIFVCLWQHIRFHDSIFLTKKSYYLQIILLKKMWTSMFLFCGRYTILFLLIQQLTGPSNPITVTTLSFHWFYHIPTIDHGSFLCLFTQNFFILFGATLKGTFASAYVISLIVFSFAFMAQLRFGFRLN